MRREMALAIFILGISFPCFSEQGLGELNNAVQASQAAAGASDLGAARDMASRPVDGNEIPIPGVVAGSGAAVKVGLGLRSSSVKTDARPALSLKSRRPSRSTYEKKVSVLEKIGGGLVWLTAVGAFLGSVLAFAGVISGGWVVGAAALGVLFAAGIAGAFLVGL